MLIKYVSSVLIVTSGFTLAFGQTPEAKKEKAPQAFAFAFDGGGGYLGVQTVEVNKDNFSKFGLRDVRGVAVEKVMENSPAAAAGIKDGDVILRFDGEEITSARKLTRLVGEVDPDHQVKLTVSRNGSEQEITATIGKRPTPTFGEGNFKFEMPAPMGKFEMPELKGLEKLKDLPMLKDFPKDGPGVWTSPDGNSKVFTWRSGEGRIIGVGVTPLTDQLAKHFNVEDGLLINEVRENSAAARAGLKAGDIIVEANGKAVKNDLDLVREVNSKKEGDVQLTIVRDRKRQTISVTPEASKDGGFFFRNDNEDGAKLMPPTPRVAMPASPMVSPIAPMTPIPAFRFGRII